MTTDNEHEAEGGAVIEEQPTDNLNVGRPGLKLRDGRIRMGCTIEEAAIELGLKESSVRDIEAEQFDRFFGEIYVRGYLRNYAKFVAIDPKLVIQSYEQLLKKRAQEPSSEPRDRDVKNIVPSEKKLAGDQIMYSYRASRSTSKRTTILITLGVALTVITALVIYVLPQLTNSGL